MGAKERRISEMMDDFMDKHAMKFKIINIASGIFILSVGVLSIFGRLSLDHLIKLPNSVFLGLFGVMILSAEYDIPAIKENMSFLNTLFGRGIFNIYIATLFTVGNTLMSTTLVAMFILGLALLGTGFIYVAAHLCTKSNRDQARERFKKEALRTLIDG
eukprot:TRINITY_DN5008_c0_g2_i2.p1 TRINITY_DN5008_c0_g2~~TRINITY_DN5008_c0_g2_i2.p1  ORF type:complete len:167 (+),score=54.29 TRINITY_DN5008_c0_g2_i2:25-501(+)